MQEYTYKMLKSKTNWYNVIVGCIYILEVNIHMFENYMGKYYPFAFVFITMVGFYIRSITTKSIKDK